MFGRSGFNPADTATYAFLVRIPFDKLRAGP
jgi:hypothetical protein